MTKQITEMNRRAAELVVQFDAFARRFMVQKGMDRREPAPLTRPERRAVAAIGRKRAWKAGELARDMGMGVSSLTSVLDKLVAKDLAARERSNMDRRVVWVRLTPQGRQRYARFRRLRFRKACGMLGALDEKEQEMFIALMRRIGGGASDAAEPERVGPRWRPEGGGLTL